MTCCCENPILAQLQLKKVKPCPIHCCTPTLWASLANTDTNVWRTRLQNLIEKTPLKNETAGRKRKVFNTHGFRRGGAQTAVHSLGRRTMEILGRWKSTASKEYEGDSALNPSTSIIPKWPLLAEFLKPL